MSRDVLPQMNELVSTIHRDGGFRCAHVGLYQATGEATEMVRLYRLRMHALREENARLVARNERLKEELDKSRSTLREIVRIITEEF